MKTLIFLMFLFITIEISYSQTVTSVSKIFPSVPNSNGQGLGRDVQISGDYAIAGADGAAYILYRNAGGNNIWGIQKRLVPADVITSDYFGSAVSLSGDYALVGAYLSGASDLGAVYLFYRHEGGTDNWGMIKKIVALDQPSFSHFGNAVLISDTTVVIASTENSSSRGSLYVLEKNAGGTNNWGHVKKIQSPNPVNYGYFGVSIGLYKNDLVVGAYGEVVNGITSGATYIFNRNYGGSNNWGMVKRISSDIPATNDNFGFSVDIDEDFVVVGADFENEAGAVSGAAYIYYRNQEGTNQWGLLKKVLSSDLTGNDHFGNSVSISGEHILISSFNKTVSSKAEAGAVYLYSRNQGGSNNWGEVRKITPSTITLGENFGFSNDISGRDILIGTPYNDDYGIGEGVVYAYKYFPYTNTIRGKVINDENGNCIKESGEKGIPSIVITAEGNNFTFFASTDSSGNYTIEVDTLPATYIVKQVISVLPDAQILKQTCPTSPSSHSVTLNGSKRDTSSFDFYNYYLLCYYLTIDVTSNRRRVCAHNNTYVKYQNLGPVAASNVEIKVSFPKHTFPITSSVPWESKSNNELNYKISTLSPYQTGFIIIKDSVACIPSIIGLTECTSAIISPKNQCYLPSNLWDGSSIVVNGICEGGFTNFTIKNEGSGNMIDSSEFRIFSNDTLIFSNKFKIENNDSIVVKVPANGNTIRLEADQNIHYPGKSNPRASIEACHGNTDVYQTGFILTTPLDDEIRNHDISCMPIIGSYDPNDKQVTPVGISSNHYIEATNKLEYLVRFQNTGSDTAYIVVIKDTLSSYLDLSTFANSVSSHNFTWEITGKENPVVTWTCKNINLPHKAIDELGSQGFIKYSIYPNKSVPKGTRIKNKASIYFDFNDPVITNETENIIWDTIIIDLSKGSNVQVITGTITALKNPQINSGSQLLPNPFESNSKIVINENSNSIKTFNLLDMSGKIIYMESFLENSHDLNLGQIKPGFYYYQVVSEGKIIGFGKAIVTR